MSVIEIRQYGDPILRETASPIVKITDAHRKIARDMADTMYAAKGIGLAATQVGILERLVVVDVHWARAEEGKRPDKKPIVLINPEVIEESADDEVYSEGCLSLPGIDGDVWRSKKIKVRYRRIDGKKVEEECEDLHARCILHEIDHLNGVLFIDRMGKLKRRMLNTKLNDLEKKYQSQMVVTEGVKSS